MDQIGQLQDRIIKFRDARDWKQFHNPKDLGISLMLEVAELIEHFQWKTPEEITQHLGKHREDFEDEMADVLYYVLLIAKDLDIDLAKAFDRKLSKNETKYPENKARGNHKKYNEYDAA